LSELQIRGVVGREDVAELVEVTVLDVVLGFVEEDEDFLELLLEELEVWVLPWELVDEAELRLEDIVFTELVEVFEVEGEVGAELVEPLEPVLDLELDVEDFEEVDPTVELLLVELLAEVKVILEEDDETADADTQRT
jgi:hypothetical protein